MTEASVSAPTTGSDKVGALFGGLHPVTRFLIIVAILHLAATLILSISYIMHPTSAWASEPLSEHLAVEVKSVAYSLTFFGGAATVEFLFRIWDELKRARLGA